jgi:hypothetical protein
VWLRVTIGFLLGLFPFVSNQSGLFWVKVLPFLKGFLALPFCISVSNKSGVPLEDMPPLATFILLRLFCLRIFLSISKLKFCELRLESNLKSCLTDEVNVGLRNDYSIYWYEGGPTTGFDIIND